jgi:short-subunit dehydrogenase
VVLAARRADRLQALADEIASQGGQALPVETDVGSLDDLERLVKAALDSYGQIDVLFNNAGFGRLNWLDSLDPLSDIQAQIQVNLVGVIQLTRQVLPHMIERRQGHIISMGSVAGLTATPTYTIYAASKFGVRGFNEALRREVGVYGIHVSMIYPGGVATEFGAKAGIKRRTGLTTPKRLKLTSEQVAQAVYSLVQRPRRMVVLPWIYRLPVAMNALFPGITDWIIEQRFVKVERGIH